MGSRLSLRRTTTVLSVFFAVAMLFLATKLAAEQVALKQATVADFYSVTLRRTGGVPPFKWSVVDGALPDGVMLDEKTGTLTGTPTKPADAPYTFTVKLQDSSGRQFTQQFSIQVIVGELRILPPDDGAEPSAKKQAPPRAAADEGTEPSAKKQAPPRAAAESTPSPQPAAQKTRPITDAKEILGQVVDEKENAIKYAQVSVGSGKNRVTTTADSNGSYSLWVPKDQKEAMLAATANGYNERRRLVSTPELRNPVSLRLDRASGGELMRAVVGFEQSGASSANRVFKYFSELFVTTPFPWPRQYADPDFGPRVRLWGNTRITTMPQQVQATVGNFAVNFADNVSQLKVNELAQAAEFAAGVEVRLLETRALLPSFAEDVKEKFSLGLIVAAGGITPFTPRETLEVFQNDPDSTLSRFPQAAGKQNIAFVLPDRDRFFRQYFGGFRLKTYYFDAAGQSKQRFPATLDVTYGVNESVTGGRVRGGVLRVEGFYPLPWDNAKYIYLFGNALMKPARASITTPLVLQPATGVTIPNKDTALVTVPQINRDYYRIGVGVDLISLAKTIRDGVNTPKAPKLTGGETDASQQGAKKTETAPSGVPAPKPPSR